MPTIQEVAFVALFVVFLVLLAGAFQSLDDEDE